MQHWWKYCSWETAALINPQRFLSYNMFLFTCQRRKTQWNKKHKMESESDKKWFCPPSTCDLPFLPACLWNCAPTCWDPLILAGGSNCWRIRVDLMVSKSYMLHDSQHAARPHQILAHIKHKTSSFVTDWIICVWKPRMYFKNWKSDWYYAGVQIFLSGKLEVLQQNKSLMGP